MTDQTNHCRDDRLQELSDRKLRTWHDMAREWPSGSTQGINADAFLSLVVEVRKLREEKNARAQASVPEGDDVYEAMIERGAIAISERNLSNTGIPYPLKYCRENARAALDAALPLYTRSNAKAGELEEDSQRYRWLRDESEPGACAFYLSAGMALHGVKFQPETVDNFIDSAMSHQRGDASE